MFSATVAENRNGSSLTTATAARSERRLTVRMSAPSSRICPALASYRREISATRLVLPEPVAPTRATVLPAGTSRSMSLSTARAGRGVDRAKVVLFVVAQRHTAHLHMDVAAGERRRVRRLVQARLAVEHLED